MASGSISVARGAKVEIPAEVVAFEQLARRYCGWSEGEPENPHIELSIAMRQVCAVYAAALAIPGADPDPTAPNQFVDKNDCQAIYRRFQLLPFQNYGEVFDPTVVPPETPVVGDLADDLLDIYADLKAGLLYYDAGHIPTAVYEWRFSWAIHWGRHATSALKAMHGFAMHQP
jgi:hypothetical protein